jgi:hypothetical protein
VEVEVGGTFALDKGVLVLVFVFAFFVVGESGGVTAATAFLLLLRLNSLRKNDFPVMVRDGILDGSSKRKQTYRRTHAAYLI